MEKFSKERKPRERSSNDFEERAPSRSSSRGTGRFERKESRGFSRGPRQFSDRGSVKSGYEREMHEVTCDKCGQKCEVPFRPTKDKPVYCNDCFKKNDRDNGPRRSSDSNNSSRGNDFSEINKKLDKIMKALEIE